MSSADNAKLDMQQFIDLESSKSMLKFITCGSVDDGKSTLIGRLLWDSKLVFEDMLHYSMVKNNTFNGIALPSIGIWSEEKGFRLVKRFGYEDYKGRLS